MPGACCTRGLVCNVGERCAHEHTGTVGTLRHSLRKEVNGRGKSNQINAMWASCSILCHKSMQLRLRE